MILVAQYPLEDTRTPNGVCYWVAETTLQDGRFFCVRSKHGAPNELARQLVVAGIPDRPMETYDRRSGLKALTCRSFHAAAKWTYTEGAATVLQRVRYQEFHGLPASEADAQREPTPAECRETVLGNTEKGGGTPSQAVQHLADSVTPKIGVGDQQAELRQCETCGRRFRPWRPQATHCSGACRQKAYRERSKKQEAGAGVYRSRGRARCRCIVKSTLPLAAARTKLEAIGETLVRALRRADAADQRQPAVFDAVDARARRGAGRSSQQFEAAMIRERTHAPGLRGLGRRESVSAGANYARGSRRGPALARRGCQRPKDGGVTPRRHQHRPADQNASLPLTHAHSRRTGSGSRTVDRSGAARRQAPIPAGHRFWSVPRHALKRARSCVPRVPRAHDGVPVAAVAAKQSFRAPMLASPTTGSRDIR
jgi:hypothetical protein